ncbi:MAG TPA: hypothetical protein VM779_09450 [Thermoanaerobaculia bacterium]|nr:hypothetical protein [Thermoanaerobaculia bacterium]
MEVRRQEKVSGAEKLPGRFVAAAVAATLAVCIAVAAVEIDISAWRDFESDALVQQAPRQAAERYHDPSPYSMWLPSDLFVRDSIRRGDLPLWNRLQGGGYSSLNAIHEGVLHPLRWLTALAPRAAAPSILIVLAMAAAFIGMYSFARAGMGCPPVAALAAAVAFTLSSALVSNVHFSGAVLPLAHIPWAALFLRRAERPGGFLGLTSVLALLFVSGHPLLVATAAAAVGGVALADAVSARTMRPIARLLPAALAGLLIASPALLPPLLARPELWTYKTATAFGVSYTPYSVAGWGEALGAMVIDRFDGRCCIDLESFYLYVGPAAFVLALAGIWHGLRTRRRGFVVLAALAFLIAVPGPWMAPFAFPPLAWFKPWYLLGAFAFYLACLIAAGTEWLRGSGRAAASAAFVLVGVMAALQTARLAGVLKPRLTASVRSQALDVLRSDRDHFRVVSLWGQTHAPNASRLTGIEDLRLAGPILTLRYHLFWQLIDPDVLRRAYPTTRITDKLGSPLLSDFNVRYVLQSRLAPVGTFRTSIDERSRDTMLSPSVAQMAVVVRTPWIEVRRNEEARPRAHFAGRVMAVPSSVAALELLRAQPGLAATTSVVEMASPATVDAGRGDVTVSYPAESRVVLDVQSESGGLVVLHDSFAPGWTATIGGERREVFPVNLLSRGVVVPPGAHRVVMSYRPPGFLEGVGLSVAVCLGLLLWSRRAS